LYARSEKADLVVEFIINRYSDQENSPKQIFVSGVELNTEVISSALSLISGRKFDVAIPIRGEKARIGMLAVTNAETALVMQKRSVLYDLNSRTQALQNIADALNLKHSPLRIECVDVSHLQGTSRVAAVVVFEDGLPARSEYRSYVLQQPGDDLAGIREVIERRIDRFKNARARYPLGLLVIDGGPWQAQAAFEVLQAHGLDIPVVGLAKRLEELWFPAATTPILLPRDSQALYLLQQIRDETHRRAITHHRNRRSKQAVSSILDEVVGIGPERRKMLLKHFGGATGLRAAGVSDLILVKGISPKLAEDIYNYLHSATESLPESDGEDN
jgi:excinuclease ABC subunit C